MGKVDELSVTLRALEISDVSAALKWLRDEKASRFCPWNAFTNRIDAIRYFVRNEIRHPWNKAICVSGRVVGSISVTPSYPDDICRAEMRYVVATQYWKKGLVATLAVKEAAENVFADWVHLQRLEAQVDVDNVASLRVLKKAGFMMEGLLRKYSLLKGKSRDILIFSLLPTDPIP